MENADILHTIAEVSVALAGFTSIAAVLGPRALGDWTPGEIVRLALMLRASIGTLLLALLPIVLTNLKLSEPASWALTSTVMAALFVHSALVARREMQRLSPDERQQFPRVGVAVLNVTSVLVVVGLLLNTAGFVFERESGPVLLGLYWLLGFSALQFTRVLLALMSRGKVAD